MNTKDKGDLAETASMTELIRRGYSVSVPFGDNDPYDLVIEKEGEADLVQVKRGWLKNGKVVFNCYKNTTKDGEYHQQAYKDSEIDKFAVWCEERNELYLVPVDEAPSTQMHLRFEDAEVNDSRINRAEDYLVK